MRFIFGFMIERNTEWNPPFVYYRVLSPRICGPYCHSIRQAVWEWVKDWKL